MTITVNHSTAADGTFSSTGATAWNANHTLSGVGTMAEQNANSVAITGGSLNGVAIGQSVAGDAIFDVLTASVTKLTNVTSSAGIAITGTFTGSSPSDGLVMDYSTGWGRFSAFGGDGFQWYNAGLATTKLMELSSAGALVTLGTVTANGVLLTGNLGTVTSVSATVPSFLSVSGSPITSTGTLALTYSGTALPVANGGTGLATLTANYIPYGNGTSAFNSSSVFTYNGTTLATPSITSTNDISVHGVTVGLGGGSVSTNTAVGNGAGYNNLTGNTLTFVGHKAGYTNSTGNYNTFSGYLAGYTNSTGSGNSVYGYQSGYSLTTGSYNTLLGFQSGQYLVGLTTGSHNTYLGNGAHGSAVGNTNEIVIGDLSVGLGSNTTVIGNTNTTLTQVYGTLNTSGYTVATLPSTAATGMITGARTYVTDATTPTFLGTFVGGGAIKCPAFYNGTAWVAA